MDTVKEITAVKDNMLDAIKRKDVAGSIAPFAESTVMYLLNPPLRFKTGDNAPGAGGIEEWFASFEGPITITYEELEVTFGEDVAFCHSLDHLEGKRTNGEQTGAWYRETLGFKKIDGKWKITHQHQSFPTYMDRTGKSATDLLP